MAECNKFVECNKFAAKLKLGLDNPGLHKIILDSDSDDDDDEDDDYDDDEIAAHIAQTIVQNIAQDFNLTNSKIRTNTEFRSTYIDYIDTMDKSDFFSNMRMKKTTMEALLIEIRSNCIEEQEYRYKYDIKTRTYLTVWYLGSQSTYREIGELFGIERSSVHVCVQSILNVISRLGSIYIKMPTNQELNNVGNNFQNVCGFMGVVGALDCCHIPIRHPNEHQAEYLNNKSSHSMNLMGICNSDKVFTYVHIGSPGSMQDSLVFKSTEMYNKMQTSPYSVFSNDMQHIIGDSAFELSNYLLVPYVSDNLNPIQIRYNINLSKTWVVVENAFHLLIGRFRRLKFVDAGLKKIPVIIKCACVLHNFILQCAVEEQNLLNLIDEYKDEMPEDHPIGLPNDVDAIQKRDMISAMLPNNYQSVSNSLNVVLDVASTSKITTQSTSNSKFALARKKIKINEDDYVNHHTDLPELPIFNSVGRKKMFSLNTKTKILLIEQLEEFNFTYGNFVEVKRQHLKLKKEKQEVTKKCLEVEKQKCILLEKLISSNSSVKCQNILGLF